MIALMNLHRVNFNDYLDFEVGIVIDILTIMTNIKNKENGESTDKQEKASYNEVVSFLKP